MFSPGHLIFIAISFIMIISGTAICCYRRPPLDRLLKVILVVAFLLEAFKMLDVLEIVPVVEPFVENGRFVYKETGKYTAFLKAEHVPFELCSMQILFLFFAVFLKDEKWKKRFYSIIYGTAIIGGTIAILLSSIAPEYASAGAFLASPRAWEFFIYHSLIIISALYIGISKESDIHFKDCIWMIIAIVLLDYASFYMNAICSVPVYQNDRLIGVEYAVNYFSSFNDPLGIPMPEKWMHLIYLAIRAAAAAVLIPLVYSPLFIRDRRERRGRESQSEEGKK